MLTTTRDGVKYYGTCIYTVSTEGTDCNVLYLVFKSNLRQTIVYLHLTPKKYLKDFYRKKVLMLYLITCLEIGHILYLIILKVYSSKTKST